MMDVRHLVATSDPLTVSRDAIHQFHHAHHPTHFSPFSPTLSPVVPPRPPFLTAEGRQAKMIIDARSHNSALPVSPKKGETVGDAGPDSQLVTSSLTPSTWEDELSLPSNKTLTSPQEDSHIGGCSPAHSTNVDVHPNRGANGSLNTPSASPASIDTSPHCYFPSEEQATRLEQSYPLTSSEASDLSTVTQGRASCDQPDSSPASPSVEDTQRRHRVPEKLPAGFPPGLDASFERRSRRKPTIEDIVRRVRPPVDAPPYDSEESEIEDDILNDEIIAKMREKRENDEVDGQANTPTKPFSVEDVTERMSNTARGLYGEDEASSISPSDKSARDEETSRRFAPPSSHSVNQLGTVNGIPQVDDEEERILDEDDEMEMRSEDDLDKHAFLKDVPDHIYNLMHEVKVNAHAMFMKTASHCLPPEESRARREQYLLQLLSKLRDRCLEEGLKPDIIAAILKDVEVEVTLLGEDLEDLKEDTPVNQYFSHYDKSTREDQMVMDPREVHFLNKSEPPSDRQESSRVDSRGGSVYSTPSLNSPHILPSFFNTADPALLAPPPPASSSTSVAPSSPSSTTSSSQASSTSATTTPSSSALSSSSSSISSDSKPIIVTVSADMKGPPPLIPAAGGLPPLHPLASNLSETAFSPNMFGSGKLPPWSFPGGLVNGMPLYPFSPAGPLDHALARKFLPFEGGKLPDTNADKDYLKCQYCERTFRRQKNLENHVENTHQGKGGQIKPRRDTQDMYFKCSHCPYTTKHQSNLYVHLRIHTGERPYICGACGVQYSQSHSLKSHIINKHDGIMSYYIKEKRTRSPRGIGYLTTQVMHDNSIFKLPAPPLLGPPPSAPHHPHQHHPSDLEFVTKAIEMAKCEQQQHEKSLQQRHQSQDSSGSGSSGGGNNSNRNSMQLTPSPLGNSNNYNNNNASGVSSSTSSRISPTSTTVKSQATPIMNGPPPGAMFTGPHGHGPPPPFFMNGPHMSPALMFGELPPHMRNPGHMVGGGSGSGGRRSSGDHHGSHGAPPMFPGFPPFPSPHSSAGFSPLAPFSPNSNISSSGSHNNNSNSSSASPHPNLQLPPLPHHLGEPLPSPFMHQIKKEPQAPLTPQQSPQPLPAPARPHSSSSASSSTPSSTPSQGKPNQQNHHNHHHHHHHHPHHPSRNAQQPTRGQLEDGAIDLRKKSPPTTPSPNSFHQDACGGKENCAHAARLKYLRLNVVRMLGILVPNLNFAEKGISAESESVDELLQDVIESNTHEEDMMME